MLKFTTQSSKRRRRQNVSDINRVIVPYQRVIDGFGSIYNKIQAPQTHSEDLCLGIWIGSRSKSVHLFKYGMNFFIRLFKSNPNPISICLTNRM